MLEQIEAVKLRDSECKVIIKRGVNATEYFAYCEEVGCDVWCVLQCIKSIGGEPFVEENFMQAIEEVQVSIEKYDPSVIGYSWDRENPRTQLETIGTRGYIELIPIK